MDCTKKQMGDAAEMLVAAELTFAGVPTAKMPDNWPDYDLVAQPPDGSAPQRISVKCGVFKTGGGDFVQYQVTDKFDWLAIVLLRCEDQNRRIFILPKCIADERARSYKAEKVANVREWRKDEIANRLAEFEVNFGLSREGRPS